MSLAICIFNEMFVLQYGIEAFLPVMPKASAELTMKQAVLE